MQLRTQSPLRYTVERESGVCIQVTETGWMRIDRVKVNGVTLHGYMLVHMSRSGDEQMTVTRLPVPGKGTVVKQGADIGFLLEANGYKLEGEDG
jgi:hypothetical protein